MFEVRQRKLVSVLDMQKERKRKKERKTCTSNDWSYCRLYCANAGRIKRFPPDTTNAISKSPLLGIATTLAFSPPFTPLRFAHSATGASRHRGGAKGVGLMLLLLLLLLLLLQALPTPFPNTTTNDIIT